MFVHARFVQQEVGLHCEGHGHRPIGLQFMLQLLFRLHRVGTLAEVFFLFLVQTLVASITCFATLRFDLFDFAAVFQCLTLYMMSTFGHCLRLAHIFIAIIPTGDYAFFLEPVPWSTDLPSIASHRHAVDESAAAGGVCD